MRLPTTIPVLALSALLSLAACGGGAEEGTAGGEGAGMETMPGADAGMGAGAATDPAMQGGMGAPMDTGAGGMGATGAGMGAGTPADTMNLR